MEDNMKIAAVIEKILNTYAPLPFEKTCDGFKAGDPQVECTGIITSCALTVDVIRAAIREKANLIIVHEPSFYTHMDDTEWLQGDPVYEEKVSLLNENRIAVWRDHDHMHANRPDEILYGMEELLGWKDYYAPLGDQKPFSRCYHLPAQTLEELACSLRDKLHLNTGRIVGNRDAVVSNVVFAGHIFPSWDEAERKQTLLLSRDDVDVLIAFELIDWTTMEYARDAAQLGKNKAIIQTGHFATEEPGMIYLASKLKTLFGDELPVQFVASGDPYWFVS